MKKLIFILLLFLGVSSFQAKTKKTTASIDPPYWWVGMKNDTLQLQVHGDGIADAQFSVSYPGVKVISTPTLDGSKNWKFIYLTISPDTKPGFMELKFKLNANRTLNVPYELKSRKHNKGAAGFSAADVLYLVMPDRFSDGDPDNNSIKSLNFNPGVDNSRANGRHGGDLKGIINHLGYLDSLGITALWVNPVLENDMPHGSYHGYATTDYYKIDPRFGSNQLYSALIDSLHNRDMKMIMDMIFNHCGSKHPWVSDPPASDWFNFQDDFHQTNYRLSTITDPYASDYDRRLATDGWFVKEMPDLNQNNPHLMRYLIQNSIWWIENSEIDGIRMDTYPYADADQMGRWIKEVRNEYPQFSIVGECWFLDPASESYWQKNSVFAAAKKWNSNLPIVMDFGLMAKMHDMAPVREKTDAWHGLNTLYDHLALDFFYSDPKNVLRFLDNHDTDRFIINMPENIDGWKQAITFLLTVPGIPQIYYGTELLMNGSKEKGDGFIRLNMPGGFPGDSINSFLPSGRSAIQNEAFDFISKINNWRKNSKAVAEGTMTHFLPDNGVYLYRRKKDDDEVIVIMNGRDDHNKGVSMERYSEILSPDASYRDMLTGKIFRFDTKSTKDFKPREILILEKI